MSVYQRTYKSRDGKPRKTKTWYVDFEHAGKRHCFPAATNKRDAGRIETRMKGEILAGTFLPEKYFGKKERKALGESWEAWLVTKRHNAETYQESLKRYKKYFTRLWSENKPLDDITAQMVREYRVKRERDKVGNVAINREVTALSSMLNFAVLEGWIEGNPIHRLKKLPEPPKRTGKQMDPELQKKLIDECEEALKPIVITALNTGMRKEEILSLTWGQVHLQDGYLELPETKTGEPQEVPLNDTMRKLLSGLLKRQMVRGVTPTSYVFLSPKTGSRWIDIRKPLYKAMKAAGLKTGLDGWTFHDLRHAMINNLIRQGVDIFLVSKVARHSSVRVTEQFYAEAHREDMQRAVETLSGIDLTAKGIG